MTEPQTPEDHVDAVMAAPESTTQQPAGAPQAAPATRPRLAWVGKWVSNPNAPLWAAGFVLLAVLAFAGQKHLPNFRSSVNVVVFDPVRFLNSQRAAASILSTQPNADLALTMTQVAKQAEAVILEEADGAVVLIKQAVVVPTNVRDITEDVLKRFGLPTAVPTVTTQPTLSLESLAPTDSSFSAGALREDYRMELDKRAADAAAAESKKSAHDQMLP